MVRTLAVALSLLAIAFATAEAGAPSPGNSDIPAVIRVVGTRAAPADPTPDPAGAFKIVVRDFTNNPVVNQPVTLDFTACGDVRLCQASVNGQTLNCSTGIVSTTTDQNGVCAMVIMGGGVNDGTGSGSDVPGPCVVVRAGATTLGSARFAIYDQDGALPGGNGVDEDDLQLSMLDVLRSYFGLRPFRERSDFNGTGRLNPFDLALHKEAVLRSLAGQGSGSGCADATGPRSYCP